MKYALVAFLVVESFIVKVNPMIDAYERLTNSRPTQEVITVETWHHTTEFADRPIHYLFEGVGSADAYEPAAQETSVKAFGEPGYRGEAYLLDGQGKAKLVRYTPGELTCVFDMDAPGRLQLNTNELLGWTVVEGPATVIPSEDGLLTFQTTAASGEIRARYTPGYWPWILYSFVGGLCLACAGFFIASRQPARHD